MEDGGLRKEGGLPLLEVDQQELLRISQELITIESINPDLAGAGSGEAAVARYLGDLMTRMGLEVRYQEIAPGRLNVIGILRGEGRGKRLMLQGHTDTVGVKSMEIQPFDPLYQEGRLYGRGSFDMKTGLAAMLMAVKALLQAGFRPPGEVLIALVADEEYYSRGTEALVREYTADAAVLCEPTHLNICIAHKGFTWGQVEVLGRAAHGSRPDRGIDAIVKAGKFLARLEHFEKEVLFARTYPLLGSPSVHASRIQGGTELTTYPDRCWIELERRTLPGESDDLVVTEINQLIQELGREDDKFRASFEILFSRPAHQVDLDQPIVQTVTAVYRRLLAREPKYIGVSGWMESALLAEVGIPWVNIGAAGKGLHAPVEYVEFESVVTLTRLLAETIVSFFGQ